MKTKLVIIFVCYLLSIATGVSQDVNLRITESSLSEMVNAMAKAKFYSYAHSGGSIVDFYGFYPLSASANIKPNNELIVTINVRGYANFDLGLYAFDETATTTVTVYGDLTVEPYNGGFKIEFDPTSADAAASSWLDLVLESALNGIVDNLGEVSTKVHSPFYVDLAPGYFTSTVPTLTTTENDLALSYILIAGPRFVTAFNNVNQRVDIGTVQDEEGTNNFVSYPSPKTFEWNTGTTQKLQTPLDLLDASNGKNKYKNWFKDLNVTPETDIAARRIQLSVGSQDASYKAKFDHANRIQLSNVLEWVASGGSVTYESTSGSTVDVHDYSHPTQTHPISTSASSGVLGFDWIFRKWSDGNTSQSRNIVLNTDVNLQGVYKAHLGASSPQATGGNNQRKIVRSGGGNSQYAVYESGGYVWFTMNLEGSGWSPEVQISGSSPTAKNPSIDLSYPGGPLNIHIVWEETHYGANNIYYRLSPDAGSNWNPTITLGDPAMGYYSNTDATPVVVGAVALWSFNNGIAMRAHPSYNNYTWIISNTNSTSKRPSLSSGFRALDGAPAYILAYEHGPGAMNFKEFTIASDVPYNITYESGITILELGNSPLNPSITGSTTYSDKTVMVAWDALNGGNRRVYHKQRNSSGTWGGVEPFSHGTHQLTKPVVNYDQYAGKVNVLWQCDTHIGRSTRTISGIAWTEVFDLGAGSNPSIFSNNIAGLSQYVWMNGSSAPYTVNFTSLSTTLQSNTATATATNSQRKLVRGSTGTLYLTYESDSDIFFTKSLDNGVTWGPSTYVSQGYSSASNPSICERGGHVYIIWQNKLGTGVYSIGYNYSTNGGTSWLATPVALAGASGCPDPGPTPVIAISKPTASFEIVVAYRQSTQLRSNRSTTNPPTSAGNWSTVGVAGSTSSSKNPTLLYHPNSWPYFRMAWDEGGVTVKYALHYSGSPGSWQVLYTFNPPYSQNSVPSLAISADNSIHLAFQGGGGGYNPFILITKNLNTSVYKSFGYNYFQPSITGHTVGKASVLWHDINNNILKATYNGTTWPSYPTTEATGGKYANTSISNPPGAAAYAVWTSASGTPFTIKTGPSSGPLQKIVGEGESPDSLISYARTIDISTADGRERLTVELALPEINTADGLKLAVPFKTVDESKFYTVHNIDEVLESEVFSGGTQVRVPTSIHAYRDGNIKEASVNVPISVEIIDANTDEVLEGKNRVYEFSDSRSEIPSEQNETISITASRNYRVRVKLGLQDLKQRLNTLKSEESDAAVQVAIVEQYSPEKIPTLINGRTTGKVGVSVANEIPTEYALSQNYPNPFNPETQIVYGLPTDAFVTLIVYDMLGREVQVLDRGQRSAGIYTARFGGQRFPSGMYFYRISAVGTDGKQFTKVMKMILTK